MQWAIADGLPRACRGSAGSSGFLFSVRYGLGRRQEGVYPPTSLAYKATRESAMPIEAVVGFDVST